MARATINIEGFVAKDLEVRNANGKAVVDVSVPVTPQRKNDQTNQWEDSGETVWFKATFWEDHAEVVAHLISKGALVSLTGTGIKVDAWESNGKSGVNLVVVNPTIARIAQKPRRGGQGAAPAAHNSQNEQWSTPGGSVASAGEWADQGTPF
ncbi:single-stranded DNA-binding protein [Glaciibacter psychrotolerans]|uniref:Single-stranded DNA-binding protein n=1 Tax=Glaciibacter psychrotolerans TaxID=670054 RepID=A0A7Z0J5S0_9MICO|nr:single-stranded DNA-binding protein [Leifsonia psychrotolerans]NYJ19174.1 single-stranded DNA-binding protein [Leifsonia psychrotolerans]